VTAKKRATPHLLSKVTTGIQGFDEISHGGLPQNRTSLVMGGPGTGKTVFALQALVNAARERKRPGIFVAFEEAPGEICANAATFGWGPGKRRVARISARSRMNGEKEPRRGP
jgi:circadian clock protein KaiC